MTAILNTITATFALMVAVLFLRSWRSAHDRFFLLFAGAFALLAAHWFILATVSVREHSPYHYALRLAGFLLILAAVVDKNRR